MARGLSRTEGLGRAKGESEEGFTSRVKAAKNARLEAEWRARVQASKPRAGEIPLGPDGRPILAYARASGAARAVFDEGGSVFSPKRGAPLLQMMAGDAAGGGGAAGGKPAKVPLTEFEAATYKDSTAKAEPGDDLTPDHIPSRAAIQKAREAQLGRKLTKEEANQLKQNTNTISVRTDIHKAGPTYKGNNTAAQVEEDATDLGKAARRDTDALLKNAKDQGADVKKAQEAVDKLHELNRNNGLYK